MGSLVPGWDASRLTPPKEMAPHEEEPQGYFARYEALKKERSKRYSAAEGDTLLAAAPAGSRQEGKEDVAGIPIPQAVGAVGARVSIGHPEARSLGRVSASQTASQGGGGGEDEEVDEEVDEEEEEEVFGCLSSQARKDYEKTDWATELDSLKRKPLGRTSVGAVGERQTAHEAAAPQHTGPAPPGGWWRGMEAGSMNHRFEEHEAAAAEGKDAARGTFVPQFGLTGSNLCMDK
ncbi:hypothetical protein QJQ45_011226 [Haematococcus lacustris]|nr:hypothetical protein QJQ45_011226 [Haematococcus lacustris]